MKNIGKIAFVIIGTLIGAGFASGKEIYLFFGQYSNYGKIGIVISGMLTGVIINKVLILVKENNINSYDELLREVNPKYKMINKMVNVIVNMFLLISFYIMIAGFSAYIKQTYSIPIYISSAVFVIICYSVFIKSIKGVIKANEILVPILVILIAYLGLKNIPYLFETGSVNTEVKSGWLISSILYASYNSIILIPVLTSLKNCIDSRKSIAKIAIFSSAAIIILAFLIYGLLLRGSFYIAELEMPLIEVTLQFGNVFRYMYGFIIILSIFTSAISAGYSFLQNVSKNKKQYNCILIVMCIIGILVSNIGFSKLVEALYPIFGMLGLVQVVMLLRK